MKESILNQASKAFHEYLQVLGLDSEYEVFKPIFIDGYIQSQVFDSVDSGLAKYRYTLPSDGSDQALYVILKFYISGFALGKMDRVSFLSIEPYTIN